MSNNLVNLMFDIETLGMRENTVILSVACVPFTFEDHQSFEYFLNQGIMIKFNVKDQIEIYKRSICSETVAWWKEQSKEARAANLTITAEDRYLVEGLTQLSKFIGSTKYDSKKSYVFARGTYFDFPKLEHAYEVSAKLAVPFNTYKIRDVRTFIDIFAGVDDGQYDLRFCNTSKFVKHNCLHDAAMDAARLNELYYVAQEDPPF